MVFKEKSEAGNRSSKLRCLCVSLILLFGFGGLMACGGSDESKNLQQAINLGDENVVTLQIVSEEGKSLFAAGEHWQFTVNAIRADGSSFAASEQVSWTTGDSAVASIDSSGQFTAAAVNGSLATEVIARWGPVRSTFIVTVSDAKLVNILTAVQSNPVDECLATSLNATGVYSDGSNRPLSDVTWSVSHPTLASVTGNSLLTFNSGTTDITAIRDNLRSAPLTIVISDSLNGIRFSRGAFVNAQSGQSLQLQTFGDFGLDEADITTTTSWSSADPSLVSVSRSGLLQALRPGDTSVNAGCGGLIETVLVSVVDVSDISIVDPEDTDIGAGESRQLEIYRVFSDTSLGSEDLSEDENTNWNIDLGEDIASISDTGELMLADDISNFEDSFIRVFAEYQGFEDTLVIDLDR